MAPSLEQMRARLGDVMASAPAGLSAANQLCTACVDLLGVDGAAISMVFNGQSQGTFGSSSQASRRLDEYQFTYGEGPCLDAAATRSSVLVPDLDSPHERRWPMFAGQALEDGYRAVFALPVMISTACIGALDLFRAIPGPLHQDQLTGGLLAAELAGLPLLDLMVATAAGHTADPHRQTAGDRAGDQPGDAEDPGGWARLTELDRVEVYQATGMLIVQLDVDATEALARLRGHAVASGQTASQVAWAIVHGRLELDRDDPHDNRHDHQPGEPGGGDSGGGQEGEPR